MSKNISAAQVKNFWSYMCDHYNTKWVYKPSAWQAKVAATFLDTIGIINKKTFMERFSFILGSTIYLPFKPGELTENFPAQNQISAAIHEHQHLIDGNKMGKFTFNWQYVFSKSKRAILEANAYQTNIEVYHWYTGRLLDPIKVANVLKNYGCNSKHISTAAKILELAVPLIKQGLYESEATLTGLKWLERHMNDYRNPLVIKVPSRFLLEG